MANRVLIESITIKNFRSIRNLVINTTDMNVFVGLNDAGKSNILKALNLFFNGYTDYDRNFDFDKDFSYLFPKGSHSAKEIKIELKVQIPDNYKNSGTVIWTKTWRSGNTTGETIVDGKGATLSSRSRIPITLRRIKFRYVPAVKSKDFYKFLLSELYLTVAASMNDPLSESIKNFSSEIQSYTSSIQSEVSSRIGIDSKLSLPSDMSEMFKSLVFVTNDKGKDYVIPLELRGDGIQARHIPIVLKYLADQDYKVYNQGSVSAISIWGYEEPENGIELLKAFEVANSFQDYSKSIQLFITTHSPAFYTCTKESNSKVFFVTRNESNDTVVFENLDNIEISKTIGLMPIVAPYIAEKQNEIIKLQNSNINRDIPTIFVEGSTDKDLLMDAIGYYSPDLNRLINDHKLCIYFKRGEGGCIQLRRNVLSWIYSNNKSKTLAIFDCDSAGIKEYKELKNDEAYNKSSNNKISYISPNDNIKELLRLDICMYYEIEHLLSLNCWKRIICNNFANERACSDINDMLIKHIDVNKSAVEIYKSLITNSEIRDTIFLYEPNKDSKSKIVKMIRSSKVDDQREYYSGFQPLIKEIEKVFGFLMD